MVGSPITLINELRLPTSFPILYNESHKPKQRFRRLEYLLEAFFLIFIVRQELYEEICKWISIIWQLLAYQSNIDATSYTYSKSKRNLLTCIAADDQQRQELKKRQKEQSRHLRLVIQLRDSQRKIDHFGRENSFDLRGSFRFMAVAAKTRTSTDGDFHDRVTTIRVNNCPTTDTSFALLISSSGLAKEWYRKIYFCHRDVHSQTGKRLPDKISVFLLQ